MTASCRRVRPESAEVSRSTTSAGDRPCSRSSSPAGPYAWFAAARMPWKRSHPIQRCDRKIGLISRPLTRG